MTNISLQPLLQKEVSRKEFLGLAMLTAGSLFGFGTIIKALTGKSLTSRGSNIQAGYGGNGYGR